METLSKSQELTLAVARFISYIKMQWDTEQAFEIAYDSVFDIIEKEDFLNMCQLEIKSIS